MSKKSRSGQSAKYHFSTKLNAVAPCDAHYRECKLQHFNSVQEYYDWEAEQNDTFSAPHRKTDENKYHVLNGKFSLCGCETQCHGVQFTDMSAAEDYYRDNVNSVGNVARKTNANKYHLLNGKLSRCDCGTQCHGVQFTDMSTAQDYYRDNVNSDVTDADPPLTDDELAFAPIDPETADLGVPAGYEGLFIDEVHEQIDEERQMEWEDEEHRRWLHANRYRF